MTSYLEAVDAMFGAFNEAWSESAPAIVGTVPTIYWQGTELPETPISDDFWCMVSNKNVIEQQSTLKTGIAPSQNRRYTIEGMLIIQLFCPLALAQSMDKGRQLAVLARDVFRGKTISNIWFRNARILELLPEDAFYKLNVIVDYTYDDIG